MNDHERGIIVKRYDYERHSSCVSSIKSCDKEWLPCRSFLFSFSCSHTFVTCMETQKKTFNRTFYGMTYVELAQVFPPAVTYFFVYFSSKVYDDAQKEYIRESIIWQNERLKLENTHMAKLFFLSNKSRSSRFSFCCHTRTLYQKPHNIITAVVCLAREMNSSVCEHNTLPEVVRKI